MYTDQQLQALRDALANGVRRVRFGDREIEYRTVEELAGRHGQHSVPGPPN